MIVSEQLWLPGICLRVRGTDDLMISVRYGRDKEKTVFHNSGQIRQAQNSTLIKKNFIELNGESELRKIQGLFKQCQIMFFFYLCFE